MKGKFVIELTRKSLLALSIVFATACLVLSWFVIVLLQKKHFLSIFAQGQAIDRQLLPGLLFGVTAGFFSLFLLKKPVFRELRKLFQYVITEPKLSVFDIFFISMVTGVSEEILFRAGIQPLIGIWWSSLLFISLHGYFNPRNRRTSLYGLLMFLVSVGLGFLYERVGLVAAVSAHAAVDMVILYGLYVDVD